VSRLSVPAAPPRSARPWRVWRRVHGLIALAAGLWLGLLGATGAIVGLREPLLSALNPVDARRGAGPALPPSAILRAARARYPDAAVVQLEWHRGQRWRVYARRSSGAWAMTLVDPRSGDASGEPRGERLVEACLVLHRGLFLGKYGAACAGWSSVLLLMLAGSGGYLRWRASRGRIRRMPWPRWRLSGRARWTELHGACGSALLPAYLLIAVTGLWLAFASVRGVAAHAGIAAAAGGRPVHARPAAANPADLDRLWRSLRGGVRGLREAHLLPFVQAGAVSATYLDRHSPHERAFDRVVMDVPSGRLHWQPFAGLAAAKRRAAAIYPLHAGSYFGRAGSWVFALAALCLPLFLISGVATWLWRRRAGGRASDRPATSVTIAPGERRDEPPDRSPSRTCG